MWTTLADFSRLFFPHYCLGCAAGLAKGEETLCTRCILQLPYTGYSLIHDNPIKDKFVGRLPTRFAWAFLKFRKTGIVQRLLHQLKYNNHPEVGVRLGRIFGNEIRSLALHHEFDMIVPMPLHRSRMRKRGYNQSAKFAEGLMLSLGVPCYDNVISRHLNTSTQTRKSKIERWENVKAAFVVNQPAALHNKRVLLVDDIITTGASIEACGQIALQHGCKELSVACIAEAQ